MWLLAQRSWVHLRNVSTVELFAMLCKTNISGIPETCAVIATEQQSGRTSTFKIHSTHACWSATICCWQCCAQSLIMSSTSLLILWLNSSQEEPLRSKFTPRMLVECHTLLLAMLCLAFDNGKYFCLNAAQLAWLWQVSIQKAVQNDHLWYS